MTGIEFCDTQVKIYNCITEGATNIEKNIASSPKQKKKTLKDTAPSINI